MLTFTTTGLRGVITAGLLAASLGSAAFAQPVNDDFANAIEITGTNTTVSGSNVGATLESGESHPSRVGPNTVWWRWTAPTAGSVSVTTSDNTFDTTLAVYLVGSGTGNISPTQTWTITIPVFITHNDDNPSLASSTNNLERLSSRADFTAAAGATYYFVVAGYVDGSVAQSGNFSFNLALNSQGPGSSMACYTASATDRVFYAPFDTVIGPDAVSNTPNTGTPVGPNRFLTATTIPGHDGQVLHLNAVPRNETTNYSGRVRFLRDGMSGRSPFAFREDDFSINFWMRTANDHARLIGTRQRTNDNNNNQRGIMVNLQNGRLEFQMNLGVGAQANPPWFQNWSGGPNIADNQWHMITINVDRDSATGGVLRVDGAVVATFDPRPVAGNLGNRNFLGLGFDGVTQGNDGNFEIDEIEIYHRVLDTPEIAGRLAAQLCP